MAKNTNPGLDSAGYFDPTAHKVPTFTNAAARDAFVTAEGGTTKIPGGFLCYLVTEKQITIWDGAAWKASAAFTP